MNLDLVRAQEELMRRCYRCSMQVAEQQAQTDYLLLRTLTNPNMQVFLALVEPLELSQRLLLGKAPVKSNYFLAPIEVNVAELLGDEFTPEERQLAERYPLLMRQLANSQPRTPPLPKDCVPTQAKRLAKAIIGHLSEVAQMKFLREEACNWTSTFCFNDWEFLTHLYFSGKGVECEHWLGRRDDPRTFPVHAYDHYFGQSHLHDYVRRLGIGSTWWVVKCEQDVPATLDSITAICTHLHAKLPGLLEGLGEND